jgi:hypothetical protein
LKTTIQNFKEQSLELLYTFAKRKNLDEVYYIKHIDRFNEACNALLDSIVKDDVVLMKEPNAVPNAVEDPNAVKDPNAVEDPNAVPNAVPIEDEDEDPFD